MTRLFRKLGDWLGVCAPPPAVRADEALAQLRDANQLATRYRRAKDRRMATGNVTRDMVTGTYRPAKRDGE